MAYPQQSNFAVRGADAFNPPAWWTYTRDDGLVDVCASSGAAVLSRARASSGLSSSPARWDRALGEGLSRRAAAVAVSLPGQGWEGVSAQLARDAGDASMSVLAMRFALWQSIYQNAGLRFDAVGIPAGAVLPRANVTLASGPADVGVVCVNPSVDPLPGVVSDEDELSRARSQSVLGVRVHPGESPPRYDLSAPAPSGSVPAWLLLLVGLGGVGVVVALARSGRSASERGSRR